MLFLKESGGEIVEEWMFNLIMIARLKKSFGKTCGARDSTSLDKYGK